MMSIERVLSLPMLAELLRLPVDHRRRCSPDIRLEFRFRRALGFEFELVISLSSPKMPPAMMSIESVLSLPMLAELLRAPWDWTMIFLAKMLGVLVAVSVAVPRFKLAPEIIETRFVVLVPIEPDIDKSEPLIARIEEAFRDAKLRLPVLELILRVLSARRSEELSMEPRDCTERSSTSKLRPEPIDMPVSCVLSRELRERLLPSIWVPEARDRRPERLARRIWPEALRVPASKTEAPEFSDILEVWAEVPRLAVLVRVVEASDSKEIAEATKVLETKRSPRERNLILVLLLSWVSRPMSCATDRVPWECSST